jgi:tRNA-2-methylthio-N6-dimethylallyladenosine synthase
MQADVVLLVTCAIRDNAERRVWQRLEELKAWRKKNGLHYKVALLGCMAGLFRSTASNVEPQPTFNFFTPIIGATILVRGHCTCFDIAIERLKAQLLNEDKLVDVVAGPDAYRDLPRMLAQAEDGATQVC